MNKCKSVKSNTERLARFLCKHVTVGPADKTVFLHLPGRVKEFVPYKRLDDAMLVAEKLGRFPSVKSWMFTFMNWSYYGDKSYSAVFFNSHIERKIKAQESSLAKAISVAALKVLDFMENKK